MKRPALYGLPFFILVLFFVLLAAQGVMAEDGSSDWRPAYDLAMRWVNFCILVFLIVKYARKPLANFFKEKSEDIKKNIEEIEGEKQEILAQIAEMKKSREKSQQKLEALKERIVNQGKIKKQRIIDDAHQESKILLESAQRKMNSQILSAQDNIRSELIDQAIDIAMQKLPGEIVEKDNQNLYEQYLKNTTGTIE